MAIVPHLAVQRNGDDYGKVYHSIDFPGKKKENEILEII